MRINRNVTPKFVLSGHIIKLVLVLSSYWYVNIDKFFFFLSYVQFIELFEKVEFIVSLNIIRKTRLFKYTENFTTKKRKFSEKNVDIFHLSVQNIDCEDSLEPPRRGGSNEYSQSMVLSRNKKNNIYPCKPQFYYIKVGFKGVKIIQVCFHDGNISGCIGHKDHFNAMGHTNK